MTEIWAEFSCGMPADEGSRCRNYDEVRRDAIREYDSGLRTKPFVRIFISNDPAYQTYRKGKPLWTSKLHYYGDVAKDGRGYFFKDKSGKKRYIDRKGRFIKDVPAPFGL